MCIRDRCAVCCARSAVCARLRAMCSARGSCAKTRSRRTCSDDDAPGAGAARAISRANARSSAI
eukprot:6266338-Prymnesium_polylepis.1